MQIKYPQQVISINFLDSYLFFFLTLLGLCSRAGFPASIPLKVDCTSSVSTLDPKGLEGCWCYCRQAGRSEQRKGDRGQAAGNHTICKQ